MYLDLPVRRQIMAENSPMCRDGVYLTYENIIAHSFDNKTSEPKTRRSVGLSTCFPIYYCAYAFKNSSHAYNRAKSTVDR
jgi:hypothetical protein